MKTPVAFHRLFIGAVLAFGAPLFAQDGPTPYPPAKDEAAWPGSGPIRVGSWMEDNRTSFWKLREKHQGAVVFAGDSLIGGWKGLAAAFPHLKVANRGVGGDTSRGTLFRFQEDILDLNPRAIVLCSGTNDLSAHGDPEDVVSNLAHMVSLARKSNPALPIVICTIPPRKAANAPVKPGALEDLNGRIAIFGTGKKDLVVVDLFAALATPEGEPNPNYIGKDGIHITPAGFEKFASLVGPALESLGVK